MSHILNPEFGETWQTCEVINDSNKIKQYIRKVHARGYQMPLPDKLPSIQADIGRGREAKGSHPVDGIIARLQDVPKSSTGLTLAPTGHFRTLPANNWPSGHIASAKPPDRFSIRKLRWIAPQWAFGILPNICEGAGMSQVKFVIWHSSLASTGKTAASN